jgi:hypothetical protein
MSYILEVQEDENGDQYITFPDEVIESWVGKKATFSIGMFVVKVLLFPRSTILLATKS